MGDRLKNSTHGALPVSIPPERFRTFLSLPAYCSARRAGEGPASLLTGKKQPTVIWCLKASWSMTRRRVISSAIRGMFQSTPRTLAESLGSAAIWKMDRHRPLVVFLKSPRYGRTIAR